MKAGTNPDGTLWDVGQWKAYATAQLALGQLSPIPKINAAVRAGFDRILEVPDDFTPEQMQGMAKFMAASVIAVFAKDMKRNPPEAVK